MPLPVTYGVFELEGQPQAGGGSSTTAITVAGLDGVFWTVRVLGAPRPLSFASGGGASFIEMLVDGEVWFTYNTSALCPLNVCESGLEDPFSVSSLHRTASVAFRYRTHYYNNGQEVVTYYQTNTVLVTMEEATVVSFSIGASGPTIVPPTGTIEVGSQVNFPGGGYTAISQRWLKGDYTFEAGDTRGGVGHSAFSGDTLIVDGVGAFHSGEYTSILTYTFGGETLEITSNTVVMLVQAGTGDVDFTYGVGGIGVSQYASLDISPASDVSGAVWTAVGLPPGVIISPVSGALSGAATAPGVYIAAITAANASVSHRELLPIGVEPSDFAAVSGLDLVVDIDGRRVLSASASSGPLYALKENDDVIFYVQFRKANTPIGVTLQSLTLTVKGSELEEVLVASMAWHPVDVAAGIFAVRLLLTGVALTEAVSVNEDPTGTQMLALCELSWVESTQWEVGPSALRGSSRPFHLLISRDLGQS